MIQGEHKLPFVHLRVQSAYSIGVGVSTPWEICAHAARHGFEAVALTDIGGTWGYVEFHAAARHFGIKPIYGVTLDLAGDEAGDGHRATLVLVALDRNGLKNVCSLASMAASENHARVLLADLADRSSGTVCIVESAQSDSDLGGDLIPAAWIADRETRLMDRLHDVYGDRLFVGLIPEGGSPETQAAALALDVPAVLTQDVRYVGMKHFSLAFAEKDGGDEHPTDESDVPTEVVDRYRFLSLPEVTPWYAKYADAYTNASMIASLVHPDVMDKLDEPMAMAAGSLFEEGGDYDDALESEARAGFERVFGDVGKEEHERYDSMLTNELEAIKLSGTADSFLRFHEITSKIRRNHIPLGPSTGLRLQSLTAYLLGITSFNPYDADERFLPDFGADRRANRILDLQIARADRQVTVTLLNQMFDNMGIGFVPSVEHVTPLRALKVTAREVGENQPEVAEVIRIAGEHPGVSIQKLFEENRDIGRLYRKSATVRELVTTSAAIEGLPIGFIRSKRTLIVSSRPLREYLGHTRNPDTGELFFQATRDTFPTASVFRIDVSTLSSLGVCAGVDRSLQENGRAGVDEWGRPDDGREEVEAAFARITDGDVDGVYLLESPLTQRLATEFGVTSFDDLVRFLAVMRYRRGDLSFSARVGAFMKGPPRSDDIDPAISFLLNDTNGWILFDDQLRELLSVLTALPGPEAAALLRRFKRTDAAGLAGLRKDFMRRAAEAELPMEEAKSWFKRILFYINRSLDRQHVLADAMLVYRTLKYKHRYRSAFLAALLNEHGDHPSRFEGYLGIAEAEGLLLAPHVNHSGREYRADKGLIRSPLGRIGGLGGDAIQAILHVRGEEPYADLEDFVRRVPSETVTNKEVEMIVAAGAVNVGEHLGKPVERPDPDPEPSPKEVKVNDSGQIELTLDGSSLPERDDEGDPLLEVPDHNGVGNKKMRNIRSGFVVLTNIAEFYPHPTGTRVELVGCVRDLHSFKTSSNSETRFFVLFDAFTSVPVFAPRERFGRSGEPLVEGDRVLVRGSVRIRDRRKVCNAVEVLAEGGAFSDGETNPDEPPEGNP
jgi:DNA polymerase-3 subunit alpha